MIRIYELLENDKCYYIVQELINDGDLKELAEQRKKMDNVLTEQEVKHIALQLFQCLNYMHRKRYIHRDLKPENIMVDNKNDLSIKVADFGFSIYFRKDDL